MICRRSARVTVDGAVHRLRRGRTTAHPLARVVIDHPGLWEQLRIDHRAPTPAKTRKPKSAAEPAGD